MSGLATREKTRLWLLILVGVVATLLGQTHAREIFAPSQPAPGVFAAHTQATTGENYDACRYDAPDSLLAAKSEGSFVYRGLAKGEDPTAGLTARAPGAGNSEISHVAGKKQSQWISTTMDEATAVGKYGEHGAVRIDLSKVPSNVSDVSGGFPNGGRMSNWAKRDREVLIQESVPAEAIERIK